MWVGALAPFFYTTPQTIETAANVGAVDAVRGGLPIACFFMSLLGRTSERKLESRALTSYALFAYGSLAILSAAWSLVNPVSVLLKAIQLLFMYLCVARVVRSYSGFRSAVDGLLQVTHIVLIAGFLEFLLLPSYTYTSTRGDAVPRLNMIAPSISANVLGVAVGVGLLALLLRVGPDWAARPWARLPLVFVYVFMLAATRSRTITIVLALACVVSALVAASRSWATLLTAIFVCAALIAACPFVLDSGTVRQAVSDFVFRGQDSTGLTTLTGRTIIWPRALLFWREHPVFGAGYYTGHRFALPQYDAIFRGYSNLDSTWIESLVDLGVVGTVLLASFAVVGIWRLIQLRTDRYTKTFAITVWLALLAISFVNPTFQSPLFTSVVGATLVLAAEVQRNHLPPAARAARNLGAHSVVSPKTSKRN